MAKVTPKAPSSGRDTVVVKTTADSQKAKQASQWWKAKTQDELVSQVLDTVAFLKEQQSYRYRQAGVYARLYGNLPLFNFIGSASQKLNTSNQTLPLDRPTMNVIQSCVDTKVSRISQSRPRPVFLTDAGNYKERNLGKKLNNFIVGEFYQTKAYELGEFVLRDACVLGTGAVKVFETTDKRVGIERKMNTELLFDPNDALYNDPRQMFEMRLVDRQVLAEMFPKHRSDIAKAQQGFPDNQADSQKTASDQIIVAEAWHLPSGENSGDGRHAIVCTSGAILDEEWDKKTFPFVFLHDSPRLLGVWGQGTPERLMGTQVEINKLLITISRSINLLGVPRVWLEQNSKVSKAHINNDIGMIGTYTGTVPIFQDGTSGIAADIYAQLQRLIEYAYQQEGVSQMAASSVKPAGLNSGEAQRAYQENQTDRLAALSKRYNNFFVDLAYAVMDKACDIAKRDKKYQTIYPNKDGTREVHLPDVEKLTGNPFIIQCFDSASLPRDPAGRLQKVTELMQAGIINPQEGRRLLDYPDIEQVDKLANASEERILSILDAIIEDGTYTPPDPFMDLAKANELVTQYYNLYSPNRLEEEKAEMLRNFFSQVQALKQAAMPPAMPPAAGGQPQASPEAAPTNPMIPNVPASVA